MKETVCLVSLGCPKNLVDSEVILGLLSAKGYGLTTDPSKAQTIIVNTCAFIRDATTEAVETIRQYAEYKKGGRCHRLVVAGCLPQRYGKDLETQFPEVDLFVGSGALQRLPVLLSRRHRGKTFCSPSSFLHDETTPRILSTPPFTAYLKIAEGCSRTCTFCTVPQIRGPYRSRRLPSLLKEARALADGGVQELILIAQDTTVYGEDLGDGTHLEKLLKGLTGIAGLRWIRMLYSYPKPRYFTDDLLGLMAAEKKICPYLDLPLQHIDDRILRRMGRKVKGSEIRALLERIRTVLPDISLRTTLIVGFPGEGEDEFQSLLTFVEKTRFDHLGAFVFSPEEGTPAARLPDPVPDPVKERRRRTLLELQKKISREKNRRMLRKRMEVLVEGAQGGVLKGRLRTQAPEVDGCVYLKGEGKPGDWVEALITRALAYDLVGEIERTLP